MKKLNLQLLVIVASMILLIGCSQLKNETNSENKDVVVREKAHNLREGIRFYRILPKSGFQKQMKVRTSDSRIYSKAANNENYDHKNDNPIKQVTQQPVSTFSIDVDTGSYANVRRLLTAGRLPPSDAVRAEEMINYFDYSYPLPESKITPFSVTRELAPTPWNPETLLLHVGLQGYDIPAQQRPASNLVFLIDVSGSMDAPDKLELLKSSLKLLTNQLNAKDKVSIVAYAGTSGVVLEPTPGNNKTQITQALNQLQAGGSTNGGEGIELAYSLAEQAFIKEGINRVMKNMSAFGFKIESVKPSKKH